MTDQHDFTTPADVPSADADADALVGEVVDLELDDVRADADVEPDVIELDDDAVISELDDEPDPANVRDRDEDVMVLDSWQIQIPATGDAKVDAALSRLAEVEGLPPGAHAEVYEAVHAGLQDALADLDRA